MALATDNVVIGPTPGLRAQRGGVLADTLGDASGADNERRQPLTLSLARANANTSARGLTARFGAPHWEGDWRPLEVSLSGAATDNLDFLMARRTGAGQDSGGAATTSGAEVRLGQRLRQALTKDFQSPGSWRKPAWYVFAASDGQAVIYTPTNDPFSPNRAITVQDRVMVGSMQAGLSVEAMGMQASLSYVKRTVTTLDLIRHSESADEEFAGLTFTWRR